jgi:hypothetical protein
MFLFRAWGGEGMSDIVERLRDGEETCGIHRCITREARCGCTCAEAADEIERLREALRPFAEAPIREVDDHDDFDICGTLAENFITIGMLKKARAALGEGKQ